MGTKAMAINPLDPYQQEDATRIANSLVLFNNNPLGMGKTRTALAAIRAWVQSGTLDHVIVFAKKSSLNLTWAREILDVYPDLAFVAISGDVPAAKRRQVWSNPPSIVLCNMELILNRVDGPAIEALMRAKKVGLVPDEAHVLCSHETQTWRRFCHLRQFAYRIHPITGTPLLSSPADIFGLMHAVGFTWPGATYKAYLHGWCTTKTMRIPSKHALRGFIEVIEPTGFKPQMLPLLRQRLLECVIRRPPDESSLPPLRPMIYHEVALNAEEKALYAAIKPPPAPKLDGWEDEAGEAHQEAVRHYIEQHLGEHGELRAILSGKRGKSEIPSKDVALRDEVLPSLWAGGEKAIVYTPYAQTVDRLERFLQASFPGLVVASITGSKTLKAREAAFMSLRDDPACRVMLLTDAGSESLNLQSCASRVWLYDRQYLPAKESQLIGRVYRRGQATPVIQGMFVVKDTIDADIARVHMKRQAWTDVVDELSRTDLTDKGKRILGVV